MESRFQEQEHYSLLNIIPYVVVQPKWRNVLKPEDTWISLTKKACLKYSEDLPSPSTLEDELVLWRQIWYVVRIAKE